MITLLLLSSLMVPQEGFENLDFEQGLTGWGVWYTDDPNAAMTRYPYEIETEVVKQGTQSLRIIAPDRNGRAFASTNSTTLLPGQRYEVSYWWRHTPELNPDNFDLRFVLRPADAKEAGWVMKTELPIWGERRTEDGWEFRRGYFRMPQAELKNASLAFYLQENLGTVWVDDVRIRRLAPEEDRLADIWIYDPHRVELGSAPLAKFRALKAAGDPTLERAKRYNEILVRSAFVQENVNRVRRLADWGAAVPGAALGERQAAIDAALAELYQAYGEAYLAPTEAKADIFDQQATTLEALLVGLDRDAVAALNAAAAARRQEGDWAPPPRRPAPQVPAISPEGRVNQILFGNRSDNEFAELEDPLLFDSLHSTTAGGPTSREPGQYDWSPYLDQWQEIQRTQGVDRSLLLLFFALHDNCYTPAWLHEKIKADPTLVHQLDPPTGLADNAGRMSLNWWHPEIQAYAKDLVSQMGRQFRDRPEFLFYLFQWESYGPNVRDASGKTRSPGYDPHSLAGFRSWLNERYATIGGLNERWQTEYASFEAIQPPPDIFVAPPAKADALRVEWEAWRHKGYADWCRLIYQTWKESDPTKPVIAGHSNLYRSFPMPEVYDTADMLNWHNSGHGFMLGTAYAHSLARYNDKPICQYENFWGTQEDHNRMFEERPKRAGSQRYVFRLTAWDRFLQIWWYSYTSAPYLTVYDGNYFDPAYGLTTLRYRTAGLPVYFEKFRDLQTPLFESEMVPSRVCLLSPTNSLRVVTPSGAIQREMRAWFQPLFEQNWLVEAVPEEYLLDGRANLADFDAVIVPYAPYLTDALQIRLVDWLQAGDKLLINSGPTGIYDELGQPGGRLLRAAFGTDSFAPATSEVSSWGWTGAEQPVLRGQIGGSPVMMLSRPLDELTEAPAIRAEVGAALERVTDRAAWDETNTIELVLRRQGESRYLCALNRDLDERVVGTIHVPGAWRQVVDLDQPGGYPVPTEVIGGETVFRLGLEPGEATVLRLE